MANVASDIALELAEKLWEFDRSERWHTKRPKQDWLEAVAALLRPHVSAQRELDELREHCISEHDCSFCALPSAPLSLESSDQK